MAQKFKSVFFLVACPEHWMFALCVMAAMISVTPAVADTIQFDPDGSVVANGTLTVTTFDFLPGNLLFRGIGNLEINNPEIDPPERGTVVYAQAKLSQLLDENDLPIAVSGLGTDFEITVVAKFSSTATVSLTTTNFALATPSPTYTSFKLYYDTSNNADDLAGTGFDDGVLILEGKINDASGSFESSGTTAQFDRFPSAADDDYAGLQTTEGVGGLQLTAEPTSIDGAYFITSLAQLQLLLANSSIITPFDQVNPSKLFQGYSPSLGTQNGLGDDFQAQGDANASFQVPEPSTFALGMLGILALIPIIRRRRS